MKSITIYHTNDMHSKKDAVSYLSKIEKDSSMLFLDAGDAIAGSNTIFKLYEDMLEEMNKAGYDAMAMGNREFNYLRWVIKKRTDQAKFSILCANLEDLTGKANGYFKPYIIKNINNIRIGIIGLTPVQYGEKSKWLPIFKFKFLDPFEQAKRYIEELKPKTDIIILLSHSGIKTDRKIAETVSGIDLLIGGHTHVLIKEPEKIGNTYIFQSASHAKYIGKIEFEANTEGNIQERIKNLTYNLIELQAARGS